MEKNFQTEILYIIIMYKTILLFWNLLLKISSILSNIYLFNLSFQQFYYRTMVIFPENVSLFVLEVHVIRKTYE
jgi:hypothetical protein